MTDPNAPTPGTENQIDYDAIEKLAKKALDDDGDWVATYNSGSDDDNLIAACDPATVLALVKRARQRDYAEKKIEEQIATVPQNWNELTGLCFALDALRREP